MSVTRIIHGQRMQLAETWRQDWVVNAEESTTIEQVMDPVYWSHMSGQLNPYDRIEVRLETGEWILELVVIQCGRAWAKVHMLNHYDLTAVERDAPAESQLVVGFGGPQHKWRVTRKKDAAVLQTGFPTQTAAREWAEARENAGAVAA